MYRLKLMLSHLSVQLMLVAFLGGMAIVAIYGPLWALLFAPLGALAQFQNEYALHRFVFHWPAPKRQWAFDVLYQAHYGHHDFPTKPKLFFAPVWVVVPVLLLNFGLVYAVLQWFFPASALALTASIVFIGGVTTFLAYEWFHMTAHLPIEKIAIEQHVTRLHNQHHFQDFSKWFHVSPGGEIIDRMMGTAIDRNSLAAKQRVEFIRTLGMQPDDPRLIRARNRFAERYDLEASDIERAARLPVRNADAAAVA